MFAVQAHTLMVSYVCQLGFFGIRLLHLTAMIILIGMEDINHSIVV